MSKLTKFVKNYIFLQQNYIFASLGMFVDYWGQLWTQKTNYLKKKSILNVAIFIYKCPLKYKMSQIELLMGDMLCLYVGDPETNSEFYFNFSQHICGEIRANGKNS